MHKSTLHPAIVSSPLNDLLPIKISGFAQLAALALDMRWSWDHASDSLWQALDAELWELTRNPWAVLQTVSHDQIENLLKQPDYRQNVERLLKSQQQMHQAPAWFQQQYPQTPLKTLAYFSMEFMLSSALPIYSGGLGNVAGDQLKAALGCYTSKVISDSSSTKMVNKKRFFPTTTLVNYRLRHYVKPMEIGCA
jgi:glycogen phosphorylase